MCVLFNIMFILPLGVIGRLWYDCSTSGTILQSNECEDRILYLQSLNKLILVYFSLYYVLSTNLLLWSTNCTSIEMTATMTMQSHSVVWPD